MDPIGECDKRFLEMSLLKSFRGRRMEAAEGSDLVGLGLGFSEEVLSENLKGLRNFLWLLLPSMARRKKFIYNRLSYVDIPSTIRI